MFQQAEILFSLFSVIVFIPIQLEEEIEKLNGSRGLRNRDDTLKLARLMVRADDSTTRHQLLDIILVCFHLLFLFFSHNAVMTPKPFYS